MAEEEEETSSPADVKAMVKEVVQAMMILDRSKKPFKYSDIAAYLTHKPGRTAWARVIDDAGKQLENIGLTLHEVKNSYTKMFILVSKTAPLPRMHMYASEEEVADRILLTLILAFIFIKHGIAFAEDIFSHLKALDIYNDGDALHPYFGNVKRKVLIEFVEKLYLSCTKVADSDAIEVRWGQRAELEITKRSVLEFICNCGLKGVMNPEFFTEHYEKVKEQEAQSSTATASCSATATTSFAAASASSAASTSSGASTSSAAFLFSGASTSSAAIDNASARCSK